MERTADTILQCQRYAMVLLVVFSAMLTPLLSGLMGCIGQGNLCVSHSVHSIASTDVDIFSQTAQRVRISSSRWVSLSASYSLYSLGTSTGDMVGHG